MIEKHDNVKFGWKVFDLVKITWAWCVICAKRRTHETHEGKVLCLACCETTMEERVMPEEQEEAGPQPNFQISQFIKENS